MEKWDNTLAEKPKRKWHWTPSGIMLAIIIVGLLAGAAFVKNAIASNTMIALGLFILALGWMRTYLNIKRINKRVKEKQEEQSR